MHDRSIIMAAPNGARKTKADHPNLPVTPAEIAAECARSMAAGAAVCHVHTRDDSGVHVLDVGRSRELEREIEIATGGDIIVQTTTECVGRYSPDELMAFVRELEPEAISVALRELLPDAAAAAPDDERTVQHFLAWLREAGVWTQFILYDAADVARFIALRDRKVIPFARPAVLFVLGRYAADQQSSPEDLNPFIEAMAPYNLPWSMCAFGKREAECAARALELGGHVRVGFENNIFLPDGSSASVTADLVALAARNSIERGRQPLTALELTELMAAGVFA